MKRLKDTAIEVVAATVPVTLVVIILHFSLVHFPTEFLVRFLIGAVMVTIGLSFFLYGVHIGLLPVGEHIGSIVTKSGKIWLVIAFSATLGILVTVAEPNVRVLALQFDTVSGGEISKNLLILTIALGAAFYLVLGLLRIIKGIPVGYLFLITYCLIFLAILFAPAKYVPLAFDSGGVTTGAVTVPFFLALGAGVTSALGGSRSSTDSFGLIGLSSAGTILVVLLLGVMLG